MNSGNILAAINNPPRNCKPAGIAASLLVWLNYFLYYSIFSKFQADMKTSKLEEVRIAMETYYEEVCLTGPSMCIQERKLFSC